MPRCEVDAECSLLLVQPGSRLACRLVELSLSGCRINGIDRRSTEMPVRVELTFKIRGIAFRLSGSTQWHSDHGTVGIEFGEMPSRRRDELVEVLCEVEAENQAKAEKEAAAKKAAGIEDTPTPPPAPEPPPPPPEPEVIAKPEPPPPVIPVAAKVAEVSPEPPDRVVRNPNAVLDELFPIRRALGGRLLPTAPEQAWPVPATNSSATNGSADAPPKPRRRERRVQSRHEVDTSAIIFLVNIAARISGRIQDLSMSGCSIHTDEHFPVGIYTRVETEFQLEGLPFRLGGVIQSLHKKNLVGIRFVDLGERKKQQLEQLIEEIEELRGLPGHQENHAASKGQSAG